MMENEGFMTMWNTVDSLAVHVTNNATKTHRGRLAFEEAQSLNHTMTTNGTSGATMKNEESFYSQLPKELVIHLVIFALQYWWYIGLERLLPARPRSKDVPHRQEGKTEMSEGREEEVVQKWIAQGKVQRASLNWCNTFLKWILEMTVGKLWFHTVEHVVRELIRLSSPKVILVGLKRVSCP
jgi:hypothetical protein